jgi:hypothetical protein
MTDQEWLACTDPTPMLQFLRGKTSDRKMRLFACACVRRIWHLLTDDRNKEALDVTEAYAEGLVPKRHFKRARRRTFQVRAEQPNLIGPDYWWGRAYAMGATDALTIGPYESALDAAQHAAMALAYGDNERSRQDEPFQTFFKAERSVQASLVHDIFGNPFRPVTVDPVCLTPQVIALAQEVYDDRAFNRLPDLADALENAGCDNAEILAHCRGSGAHVRGCWAVDLVLGKE